MNIFKKIAYAKGLSSFVKKATNNSFNLCYLFYIKSNWPWWSLFEINDKSSIINFVIALDLIDIPSLSSMYLHISFEQNGASCQKIK